MKRALPTVQRRSRRRGERVVPPRERREPAQPLVTVGYANQVREAGRLALQLTAAFARRGVPVAALLATAGDEPIPDVSVGAFLEAGANGAKSVHVPAHDGDKVLDDALARLSDARLIIGLGNVLALYYRPFFSIVVSGHRRRLISDETQIMQADLELTSPSDVLADELAKILESRLG